MKRWLLSARSGRSRSKPSHVFRSPGLAAGETRDDCGHYGSRVSWYDTRATSLSWRTVLVSGGGDEAIAAFVQERTLAKQAEPRLS